MRHRRKRRPLRWIALLTVLVLAAGGWLWLDARLRPAVAAYTDSQAETDALEAADAGVAQAMAAFGKEPVLAVTRDDSGGIRSVEADMTRINRLQVTVARNVTRQLSQNEMTVRIPLGTLADSDLLSGRGPEIAIRVRRDATVVTALREQFGSAGINQTTHQLWLTVKVSLMCVISGTRRINVDTESEYLVAETVLVGTVPQSVWGSRSN